MPKLNVQSRFAVTPNRLLNDPKISWKAKWLYWYLQSKPEDWDFAVLRISKDTKDGEKATISGIKELEKAWYLQRRKFQNEKGHWDIEYLLFDDPNAENRQAEMEPIAENPSAENRHAENRQIKKKRSSKKEIYISNEKINEKILEYIECRKQLKKEMTEIAITKLVNKCEAWLKNHDADKISEWFDRAIEAGWRWVFELKEERQKVSARPKKQEQHEMEGARETFDFWQ